MPGANQYRAADFIAVIPGSGGIISAIARRVGCDWHTAKKYIELHPTVKAVYDAEKEGLLDLAETKLIGMIQDGNAWAIKYYLAKMGAHRGWGDKIDVSLGGAVEIKVIYEDEPRTQPNSKTETPTP